MKTVGAGHFRPAPLYSWWVGRSPFSRRTSPEVVEGGKRRMPTLLNHNLAIIFS